VKYRLLQKLGTGGMAEVFHAVGEGPEGFERPFAVKRIHPRLSKAPEFSRMFVDEARISARLVHPNIVQVFEFVQQDGDWYIVMEPVDGVDMGRVFRRMARQEETVSPLFCAEVARQACRGLQYAHALTGADGQAMGIIHRDVTPPNIMVDWNGTVKVLDFGIARAMQDVQSHGDELGTVRGKVSYVAPELLEGRVADARSDVFSLAVVLHELLSGQRLFLGENDLETLRLVRDLPIPPPSARNGAVKAALDAIVMRGLERDPAKRYQSARELGDELEEFVMRRQFSMRALAEEVRALFPAGAADEPATPPATSEGEALLPAVPVSIGQPGSGVLEGAAEQRRRATPLPAVAALPPPVPPPPPPAHAVVARPAAGSGSGRIAARVPPPRGGFRLSMGASLALVGLSLSAVVVALLVVASVRRARPTGASAVAGRASDGAGAANDPAGAVSRTVQIALDSVPQGATVVLSGAATGEPPRQTPLVLPLARGEAPIELVLTKAGFAPLSFRVIPNRDKDATAVLERETAPVAAALLAATEDEPRPKRKRSSRKARAEAARAAAAAGAASAAAAATSAAVAAPAAPARPAPAAAAPAARAAAPSGTPPARDVALAPGSAPRH